MELLNRLEHIQLYYKTHLLCRLQQYQVDLYLPSTLVSRADQAGLLPHQDLYKTTRIK